MALQQVSQTGNFLTYAAQEAKGEIAQWLVESLGQLDVDTVDGRDTRSAIVELLARYGDNQKAKQYILNVLTEGPADLRFVALRFVGDKGVGGKEVFKRIEDLCTVSAIREIDKIAPLFRLDRSRARPELLRLIRTTTDKATLVQAAKYIQRYEDAALLGAVLSRFSNFA